MTGLAVMHPHAANYFMHGKPPQLTGNEHPDLVPYAIFSTRTDNIFIGVGNAVRWVVPATGPT